MPLWFVAGTVLGETLIGVEIRKVTRQRRAAHQIHALVNRAFLARDLVNSGSSYHQQRRLTVGGRERENRSGSRVRLFQDASNRPRKRVWHSQHKRIR